MQYLPNLDLSMFVSDNYLCKVDIVSVKTRGIMSEEKYGFSHFCNTTAAELTKNTLFSENNFF